MPKCITTVYNSPKLIKVVQMIGSVQWIAIAALVWIDSLARIGTANAFCYLYIKLYQRLTEHPSPAIAAVQHRLWHRQLAEARAAQQMYRCLAW